MTEFQATVGLIALLGILLALSRLIQFERQRRKDFAFLVKTFAPHVAQLEQVMHMLTVSIPKATEAAAALCDAMQKIGIRLDDCSEGPGDGPRASSIRVNVVGP